MMCVCVWLAYSFRVLLSLQELQSNSSLQWPLKVAWIRGGIHFALGARRSRVGGAHFRGGATALPAHRDAVKHCNATACILAFCVAPTLTSLPTLPARIQRIRNGSGRRTCDHVRWARISGSAGYKVRNSLRTSETCCFSRIARH